MSWVVDTCMVIDVLDYDPEFGEKSAAMLDSKYDQGLVICPVSYIELAPAFLGDMNRQNEFLDGVGIQYHSDWTAGDILQAHNAWYLHIEKKRSQQVAKRPVADILIGAFAMRHTGLLTRNHKDFASLYPQLQLES